MSEFTDLPKHWAAQKALSEAEAFEYAIGQTNAVEKRIIALEQENADLRQEVRVQAEQINRLRETLRRGQEDWCE